MPSPKAFSCPMCGETVPAKAKACPHCGACDKSGWNEAEAGYDGLDLPNDDFDYEKFKEEEFGTPRKLSGKRLVWWWTSAILAVVLAVLTLANLFFRE